MHVHEIIDTFSANGRAAAGGSPGVSLHSNLFLDSLGEIKRQVDGGGCQEQDRVFLLGCVQAIRTSDRAGRTPAAPRGSVALKHHMRSCFCCLT